MTKSEFLSLFVRDTKKVTLKFGVNGNKVTRDCRSIYSALHGAIETAAKYDVSIAQAKIKMTGLSDIKEYGAFGMRLLLCDDLKVSVHGDEVQIKFPELRVTSPIIIVKREWRVQ